MTTLKELNNHWYWRLAKVIYFTFLILSIIVGILGSISTLNYTYDSKKVQELETQIKQEKEHIITLLERFPKSTSAIPRDTVINEPLNLKDIRIILA